LLRAYVLAYASRVCFVMGINGMGINVTIDPPSWVSIKREKFDRLVLLAAYEINERSGALIDRLEEKNEGQKPKARKQRRRRG